MTRSLTHLALVLALLVSAVPAMAADGQIADVFLEPDVVAFRLLVPDDGTQLIVSGPRCFRYDKEFGRGQTPVFQVPRDILDGFYTYRLSVHPQVDSTTRSILKDARANDNSCIVWDLRDDGRLPDGPQVLAGHFTVDKGLIILDEPEDARANLEGAEGEAVSLDVAAGNAALSPLAGASGNGGGFQNMTAADFVIADDLIVDGSACIGFDCVNGEVFSFDTIRLKENNLRIKFEDTSTVPSFPSTDWQLTANESANGGANKFSIEDISGGRTPFTVEGNAPSHSLYVDDGGRLGLGTSTPSVEIHVIDGDTPTLRLQQDGSSGFEPQTWDVAGNETNFFVRDVTNGSTLPFRIRPGAPSNSIFVDVDGDVGMGTSSPVAALEIEDTGGEAVRDMLQLTNNGRPRWRMEDTSADGQILTVRLSEGQLDFSFSNNPGDEVEMEENGDMTIAGTLTENSDRNKKHNIVAVEQQEILAKVMDLPIATWQRIGDDADTTHLGPMAQDFHALFGLGIDNTHIATIDTSGVALAAIQALGAKLTEKQALLEENQTKLEALEEQNSELAQRLEALEALLAQ